MIKDIVVAIVQDYNLLRKELKLDYNENEIKTGIPGLQIKTLPTIMAGRVSCVYDVNINFTI